MDKEIKLTDFLSLRKFFNLKREDIDYNSIIVMISVALCLTLSRFGGNGNTFLYFYSKLYPGEPVIWKTQFWALIYWSCSCSICYFVIPSLVIKFILKDSIRAHGLKIKGMTKHLWIYAVLYLIVLVGVVIASFQDSFLKTYPFFKAPPGEWRYFLIFELFYFFQFCTLEFFFRGYILFQLEKKFSFYAIFIMVVPYCMIHFQKPFLEALAAILAGTILGMIALRTRSIMCGVLIHCSVAFSMDYASLLRNGYISSLFGLH